MRPLSAVPPLAQARSILLLFLLGWLAACAGPSPRPDEMARRQLPPSTSDPATRQVVGERTAAARRLLEQRRFAEAEAAANAALELDPGADVARAILGNALLGRSRREEPSDLHLQNRGDGETLTASTRSPADPVVALLRGTFLADVGHLSAAAAVAEDCLQRMAPGGDEAYVDLLAAAGEWCYELGEEQRALVHLRALVRRRSSLATAHFRLGDCLLRTANSPAQVQEAAAAFAHCARLSPGDDDALLAVVAAYVRGIEMAAEAGTAEERAAMATAAVAASDAVIAQFPDSAQARYCRGVLAERLDEAAAEEFYRAALQRDADHLGALLNLAALRSEAGDLDAARTHWRRALEVDQRRGGLSARERRRATELLSGSAP